MGQGRHRGVAEVFRLHRVEYKGQAHELRVHRHDRRLPEPAPEARRAVREKRGLARLCGFFFAVEKPTYSSVFQ